MPRAFALAGLLLSALVLASGCASMPGPLGAGQRSCIPHFPYAQGWLGGDAVYSVPVPTGTAERETIWLFGDTYVGAPEATDREGAALIHNSVGVSRCASEGVFEIEYAWRSDESGAPAAVFVTDRERHYVWPLDGFFLGDQLYVVLVEVRTVAGRGPLRLPIRVVRTLLARVENPDDPPAYWRVEQRVLTDEGEPIVPGGVYVERGFVHGLAAGGPDATTHGRFLIRLPIEVIERWPDDLTSSIETFTNRGAWEPGLHAANARIMIPDVANEPTLDRIGETGRYFVVYGAPLQTSGNGTPSPTPKLDSSSIFVRTAPSLTGPWSKRQRLHVMSDAFEAPRDPRRGWRFCYAAKAHAEHSPEGILVMTYVCNLAAGSSGDEWITLGVMKHRMDVYRPRVVTHPWPPRDAFEAGEAGEATPDDG